MDQEFTIDKKVLHVKVFVDKPKESYIFKCSNCHKTEQFHFDYFKYTGNMKETGERFLFDHKECK